MNHQNKTIKSNSNLFCIPIPQIMRNIFCQMLKNLVALILGTLKRYLPLSAWCEVIMPSSICDHLAQGVGMKGITIPLIPTWETQEEQELLLRGNNTTSWRTNFTSRWRTMITYSYVPSNILEEEMTSWRKLMARKNSILPSKIFCSNHSTHYKSKHWCTKQQSH